MIPAQFDYVAPESLEEALSVLAEAGDDAKVLAGGQSLLPVLRMRLNAPEKVLDLRRIPGLTDISEDGDSIVIGSMATHTSVITNALVREHALLLSKTVAEVADPQIRHRGTVGGPWSTPTRPVTSARRRSPSTPSSPSLGPGV